MNIDNIYVLSCNEPMARARRKIFDLQLPSHIFKLHINESTATDPEVNIAEGHIAIWERAREDDWCVVLEDDAIINDLNIISVRSDIMFVSLFSDGIHHRGYHSDEYDEIKPHRTHAKKNCGLVGYCINVSYALDISQQYNYNVPIDHYIYNIVNNNQLVTKYNKVSHKTGWSLKSKSLV